jgi:putative flippase GtrA
MRPSPASSLRLRLWRLLREMAKFGVVGAVGFIVDVGVFNLLRYDGSIWPAPLADRPVTAKIISVCVATLVTYLGNRHWTWRHRSGRAMSREVSMFFMFNAIGLAIAVACLWVSHYVLGFTGALADNIAANGVGLLLGTLFRFWSYRTFVFVPAPSLESSKEAGGEVSKRNP